MPRISVIIPTWNRRALLQDAVASVLAQTMPDLEVLVADDGSTDDTAAMLAALGDTRVRHLPLAHSGEPATPRNAGLAAARAPLVAFLDSDDVWDPDKLARQVAALPDGGWSFTGYRIRRANSTSEHPADPSHQADLARALLEDAEVGAPISSVVAPAALVRQAGGFNPATAFREDRALLFRLAARAPVRVIPDPLVTIGDHPGRSTRHRRDHQTAWAAAYADFLPVAPGSLGALTRRQFRRHLRLALPGGLLDTPWWRLLPRILLP